jgi:hypothetical protein
MDYAQNGTLEFRRVCSLLPLTEPVTVSGPLREEVHGLAEVQLFGVPNTLDIQSCFRDTVSQLMTRFRPGSQPLPTTAAAASSPLSVILQRRGSGPQLSSHVSRI